MALKPGNRAPASGQYEEIGPRGGRTGHEVTTVRGEPLPPTSKPGSSYVIVDRTRNDSGRGRCVSERRNAATTERLKTGHGR